jgi:type II secretory pathway component PulF
MAIAVSRPATAAAAPKAVRKASASDKIGGRSFSNLFRKPVKPGELIFFNSQLSLMMEIGIPLTNALHALADQTKNPVFKQVILTMLHDLEEGRQLSDAMTRYPEIFNSVFVGMVRAGETGGFLRNTLDSIIVMQEKRQALVTQLRSTLTYPVMLCVMSIAVIIFVLVGVLPKFAVLFSGKESILPFNTRFLMAASASLRTYWWAYLAGSAALFGACYHYIRSARGEALIDRLLVNSPVIGTLANKIYTCQLLRTLGHLMESSVTLVQSLAITQPTFKNRYFRDFVGELKERVEQGDRFARLFASNPHIMESVKQMIATGEEVGDLSRVMLRLARFYDAEVERELKLVGSMIAPIALLILGAVVALIVSSVILPMFRIAGAVQ